MNWFISPKNKIAFNLDWVHMVQFYPENEPTILEARVYFSEGDSLLTSAVRLFEEDAVALFKELEGHAPELVKHPSRVHSSQSMDAVEIHKGSDAERTV